LPPDSKFDGLEVDVFETKLIPTGAHTSIVSDLPSCMNLFVVHILVGGCSGEHLPAEK
jgi:hypothetical protein